MFTHWRGKSSSKKIWFAVDERDTCLFGKKKTTTKQKIWFLFILFSEKLNYQFYLKWDICPVLELLCQLNAGKSSGYCKYCTWSPLHTLFILYVCCLINSEFVLITLLEALGYHNYRPCKKRDILCWILFHVFLISGTIKFEVSFNLPLFTF